MTNPPETSPQDIQKEYILPYSEDETSEIDLSYSKNRIQIGLLMALIGYLIFLLGARPSLFGIDRSPVVGFVQISVFLVGLALISLGSYMTLNTLWPEGKKTIAAEIGSRLISTGYVICVFTGMADIFGLGSHPLPNVFFGPLQARGMTLGMITIAIGFLLLIRYKRPENQAESGNAVEQKSNGEMVPSEENDGENFNISLSTLFQ